MSCYPNYYEQLHFLIPNSCVIPSLNDGYDKEIVSLALIVDAFDQGYHPLADKLQNSLHFQLRDETLTVMKAQLRYLIYYADKQELLKICLECPHESY